MCDYCEEEIAKNVVKRRKKLLLDIAEAMTDENYHSEASVYYELAKDEIKLKSMTVESLLKTIKENWWKWSN
jgi:hypothetical protein